MRGVVVGDRLHLGVAQSRHTALGLELDPVTLRAQRKLRESAPQPVAGVLPVGERFEVDRGGPRALHHASDGTRLVLGKQGISRVSGDERTLLVEGAGTLGRPQVAELSDGRQLVAVRRGSWPGEIAYGWLPAQGQSKLTALNTQGLLVSLPALASNGDTALVVFAARPADDRDAAWTVRAVQLGDSPGAVRTLADDAVARGPGLPTPSVAAVGSRWIVQFTTRTGVQMVSFGSGLEPLGAPQAVSESPHAEASALVSVGERAVALFLRPQGPAHELWGRAIGCGPSPR